MLDKKLVLDSLDALSKKAIFAAHQNLGENSLSEVFSKLIKEGRFDAKPTEVKKEVEGEEEKELGLSV